MSSMASQITSLTIVYSTVYSGVDERKHQSSSSLAFVRENSPVIDVLPAQRASNWKMFQFDEVIMILEQLLDLTNQMQKQLYTVGNLYN